MSMPREEIEGYVRSINRTCRGERSPEATVAVSQLLSSTPPLPQTILQWCIDWRLDLRWLIPIVPADPDGGMSLPLKLRTRSITAAQVLGLCDAETAFRIQTQLLVDAVEIAKRIDAAGRPHCGADINELILSQPLDGQEHAGQCPDCGMWITWQSPKFE